MRGISRYNETAAYTDSVKLPAGAYEVRIIRAEEQNNALCILFDIAEGEFKDYYMNKLESDRKSFPDDAKYKGVFRLWYEDERNDDKRNEQNRRRMKTALEKIRESNGLDIDFSREWDGAKLKDCRVGMIFRDEEYDYRGYQGFTAKPYGVITLSELHGGKYKLPSAKYLSTSSGSSGAPSQPVALDNDLPF